MSDQIDCPSGNSGEQNIMKLSPPLVAQPPPPPPPPPQPSPPQLSSSLVPSEDNELSREDDNELSREDDSSDKIGAPVHNNNSTDLLPVVGAVSRLVEFSSDSETSDCESIPSFKIKENLSFAGAFHWAKSQDELSPSDPNTAKEVGNRCKCKLSCHFYI